jgi:protoheme IX farnesyltransferase
VSGGPQAAAGDRAAATPWDGVRLLVEIARPRVIGLVVFTGLPALALGRDGWVPWAEALPVLFATGLAGASSSALNAWVERESDARMARTRERPLPAAALLPTVVLAYGLVLAVVSTVMLLALGGPLAATVSLGTIVFYVLGYTVWLKPRTPQNIVIGGAAGSTAPLIASAAADGTISMGAWLLFLIVFLWTPPHFWAIAIFRRKDYESAGFPMMPSIVGNHGARVRGLAYAVALTAVTLVPVYAGYLSWFYGLSALGLAAWFIGHLVHAIVGDRPVLDWRAFKVSVAYLALLFAVMLFDLA